jgi:hypothetical protein
MRRIGRKIAVSANPFVVESFIVRLVCVLSMIALLVAACTPQASLETSPPEITVATPESRATPLPAQATETPVPSPSPEVSETPTVYHWQASPVLVEFWNSPSGEGGGSLLPEFVLYADGGVITTRLISSAAGSTFRVSEARLSTEEVCALLTQIEADGFFEFNSSDYRPEEITDAATTHITVNAWRNRQVSAYALDYAMWDMGTEYEIDLPPALVATYQHLSNYSPPNLQPYQPERVALFIEWYESDSPTAAPLWPLAELSIHSLLERAVATEGWNQEKVVMLEGMEAAQVYAHFNGEFHKQYSEEGRTYWMTARPLLPLEEWEPISGWPWDREPYSYSTSPTTELTCDPSITIASSVPTPSTSGSPSVPPASPTPSPTSIADGIIEAGAPLQHLSAIGRRNAPGQLYHPSSLVVTAEGQVIVNDLLNHRLQWFSLDGAFLGEKPYPVPIALSFDMVLGADGSLVLTDAGHRVHVLSQEAELLHTFEGWPPPPSETEEHWVPLQHVAQGPEGLIYLAELRGDRVVILNADGSLREIWSGPEDSPFTDIMSLGTDAQGNLFVASDTQDRVIKRSPDGQVTEFPTNAPQSMLSLPDGSFYTVSDGVFTLHDATGNPVQEWRDHSRLSMGFYELALAPDGSLLVLDDSYSDEADLLIHRYTPEGEHLGDFGTSKDQPGQFGSHNAFTVSPQGDLWLVDTGNESNFSEPPVTRLVHLDGNSAHLATFETIAGQALTCDQYRMAAHSDQSAFLAEPCTGRIMHIGADGQLLREWGARGTGDTQYNLIRDLTLAPDEQSLFIVDEGNRRVTQVGLDGQLLQQWSSDEWGVQAPFGLAVDHAGTFYLLDGATQQVVIRPLSGELQRWSLPDPEDGVNTIAVDVARSWIYVGGADNILYLFDTSGTFLGGQYVSGSTGTLVETDPAGRVYTSTGYHEIYLFAPEDNPE